MNVLLGLILCVNLVAVVTGKAPSIVAGLTAKNLLLYSAVGIIVGSMVMRRRARVANAGALVAFGILVLLSLVSMAAVAYADVYPNYTVKVSILRIKAEQVDWLFFYAAFLLGTETRADAERMLRILLLLVGIGNLITLWDAAHLPHIGMNIYNMDTNEGGLTRVNGFYGHANETGTMIAMMLPVMLVLTAQARGVSKAMWLLVTGASVTVLVATVSRGALVGLVVGCVWASYLYRRHLSFGKVLRWVAVVLLLVVLVLLILPFVGSGYLEMFAGRFTGVSMVSARDISSGRSDMWAEGIEVMINHPWSFITGMGWNTWNVQGFPNAPHNQYLSLYFDLGLLGLGCYLYINRSIFRAIDRVIVLTPDPDVQRLALAMIFSVLTFAVGVTFSNIMVPWIFVWPYLGLITRYSLSAVEGVRRPEAGVKAAVEPVARAAVGKKRDPYSLPRRDPAATGNRSGPPRAVKP